MKNLGPKLYLIVVLLGVVLLAWRLIDTKLILHPAEHQTLTLMPPVEAPILESTSSAQLAIEQAELKSQLTAQSFLVADLESQAIILDKNSQQRLPPASTTKLMTALTALQLYDLNEVVKVSSGAARDNNGGGLFADEELRVRDLLIGLLVSSANDSAFALAEHAVGGPVQFVGKMNEIGLDLRLNDTVFANPSGYDSPPNWSTARDLAILAWQAFQRPQLLEWLSAESFVVYNTTGSIRHFLFTTNQLLGQDPRILAGKTGTTELAREVLVSLVDEQGHLLIVVVMGSSDRYADTQVILDWLATHLRYPDTPQ